MKENIPGYWKSNLSDVDAAVSKVKRGRVSVLTKSAGNRSIYLVEYGKANEFKRTANYPSALSCKDISSYADKTGDTYRPTVCFIGNIHGGEFEGIAALLNLMSIFETGKDLKGDSYPNFYEMPEKYHILIVPTANPDGRSRVPFDSLVGESFETMRYYNQGTWKDGSLCGWPDYARFQPIKEAAGYLGGYFNDDGINMMNDDFFINPSRETKAMLGLADKYVPDMTILLHGGGNCRNLMIKPSYAPDTVYDKIAVFENNWIKKCEEEGLLYRKRAVPDKGSNPPPGFRLSSAIVAICGEPCVTYETNQGLAYGDESLTHDEIYRQHIVLFECVLEYLNQLKLNG